MNAIEGFQAPAPVAPAAEFGVPPPRNIEQAGQQFEALLIGELLRMTHSEDGGWLGSGSDSANSCAMGVAEQGLAQAISAQGGFGIGTMVMKSLAPKST